MFQLKTSHINFCLLDLFIAKKLHEKNWSRECLKISLSPLISTQISLNELQKQTHGTDATAVTCPPERRGTREATVYGRRLLSRRSAEYFREYRLEWFVLKAIQTG